MADFNRGRSGGPAHYDSRSDAGGGRGFERRGSFGNRGSRGPVEMHQAVCDKCRQNCEVPFRPTSGKPIFCSSCFKSNGDFDSRRSEGRNFERPTSSEERQMFDATCDECRNACQVPFRPSGDKPVYCSNCFGEKKGAGDRNGSSQPQVKEQFEVLNNKLDRILAFLTPNAVDKTEEALIAEKPVIVEEKVAKKKTSKKKSTKV